MPVEILFPRVDMDMTSGRVGRWLVEEGGPVSKGDALFEIETDKAAMEIDASASGTLRGRLDPGGDEVAVGSRIGWILAEGEDLPQAAQGSAPKPVITERRKAPEPEAPGAAEPAAQAPGSLRATPLARREARRLGVDLSAVPGSGPRGRIVSGDVLAQAPSTPKAPKSSVHRQWLGAATGTPLVFLHGWGGDLTSWRATWAALPPGLRVLAIDLPGHGRSAAGASARLEALAKAVQDVLDEEGVASAHLIGHSLGGAVVLALAEGASIELRSLCLIAPAGLGPEIDGAFLSGFAEAQRAESMAPWLRRLFADPALVTPALVRAALGPREDASRRAYQRDLIDGLFPDGTQAIDLCSVLRRTPVPVKLIWGARDAIIPYRHSARLPGAVALHRLACGHMPQAEEPRLVAALIEQLVRSAA